MKAIIPTGGRGTRMRPLTFSSNKHFIPIANKPLIFYPIETVANTGIKEIGITYNLGGLDEVKNLLGDGSRWGLKFTYVLQEKPAGLANIVEVCEEFIDGDSFVFHLGDNIFYDGIQEAMDYFLKEKPNGMVTMLHHRENSRMGVPFFDDKGRLLQYVEKPENPPHDFAIPGIYFADANFFKCFRGEKRIQASPRGEFEIPSAFQWMIDNGFRVDVVEYKGTWLDPGKFDDWIEANKFILAHKKDCVVESEIASGSKIEGDVTVGKGCQIMNSEITGPTIIGENVTLIDCKIGPNTSIGNDSIIEGSEIENSVLMRGVKVLKVKQKISTSLIGTDSEIKHNGEEVKLFVGEKCRIEI